VPMCPPVYTGAQARTKRAQFTNLIVPIMLFPEFPAHEVLLPFAPTDLKPSPHTATALRRALETEIKAEAEMVLA
jgi:hypothetical protein